MIRAALTLLVITAFVAPAVATADTTRERRANGLTVLVRENPVAPAVAEGDDAVALFGGEHLAARPDGARGRVRRERLRMAERPFAVGPLELDAARRVRGELRRQKVEERLERGGH